MTSDRASTDTQRRGAVPSVDRAAFVPNCVIKHENIRSRRAHTSVSLAKISIVIVSTVALYICG